MPSRFKEFWRIVEGEYFHATLPVTWKRVLGDEFEPLRRLLVPVGDYGAYYPSPRCHTDPPWRICPMPDGTYEAVPNNSDDPLSLQAKDVYLQRWNLQKFSRQLAELLQMEPVSDMVAPDACVVRVGNLRVAKSEYPVLLVLVSSPRDFYREVSRLLLNNSFPFLIITGTRVVWDGALLDVLKERKVLLLAMDDILQIEKGEFIPTPVWSQSIEVFQQTVCPENLVAVPEYEFAHRGGWFIRYEDKQTVLPGELLGAFYLQRLLMSPHQEIPISMLLAEIAGDNQLRVIAGGEEIIDQQAIQNYQTRLEELVNERAEAERDGDESWLDRIDSETEQIGDELIRTTGLGGKTRKMGDELQNLRRRISKTISEAIAKISENDRQLGHHLTNNIYTGIMMSYRPDRDIQWVFD